MTATDHITFGACALGLFLPMHLRVDAGGSILSTGNTFARIAAARPTVGAKLFDLFECELPHGAVDIALMADAPVVRLRFRSGRRVGFRGHGAILEDGTALFDLALDLSELSDLGGAPLTAGDFPPTDRTLDMLYLMEAKSLAMGEALRLVKRLQDARVRAEEDALTDTLTGLKNRRGLESVLQKAAAGAPFSLFQIDLDYFKHINDSLGHVAGDAALQEAARRLIRIVRAGDTVARVGGDEFLIVLPDLIDREGLEDIARRLVAELERPMIHEGRRCRLSASIGIAVSTDYAQSDVNAMIADADAALYRSKSEGRARHTIHEVEGSASPGAI